jgi:Glycosyltransferase family 29 (sialyltransferase)
MTRGKPCCLVLLLLLAIACLIFLATQATKTPQKTQRMQATQTTAKRKGSRALPLGSKRSLRHHPSCYSCSAPIVESLKDELSAGAYVPDTHVKELPVYDTCAVVFPSSLLAEHDFGAEIDAHEAVFRVNDGLRPSLSAQMGTKCTVRVCNRHMNGATRYRGGDKRRPYVTPHLRDVLVDGEIGVLTADHVTETPRSIAASMKKWEPGDNFERTIEAVRRANKTAFLASAAYRIEQHHCQNELRDGNKALPDFTTGFDAVRFARHQCCTVTVYGAGDHRAKYLDPSRTDVLGQGDWHDHRFEPLLLAEYAGLTREQLAADGKATIPGCQRLHGGSRKKNVAATLHRLAARMKAQQSPGRQSSK